MENETTESASPVLDTSIEASDRAWSEAQEARAKANAIDARLGFEQAERERAARGAEHARLIELKELVPDAEAFLQRPLLQRALVVVAANPAHEAFAAMLLDLARAIVSEEQRPTKIGRSFDLGAPLMPDSELRHLVALENLIQRKAK